MLCIFSSSSGSSSQQLGYYPDMEVWVGVTSFGFDCREGNHKICYQGGNKIGEGVSALTLTWEQSTELNIFRLVGEIIIKQNRPIQAIISFLAMEC